MIQSDWYGFNRVDFNFKGREAIIVFPDDSNKTNKWMLKTEYFDAFPGLEIELLKRGFHLAYLKNITRWCVEEDIDAKFEFAQYLSAEYGLGSKCVPIGMSCGGLHAVNFAAKYPEYISVLYLDAPVLNLLSCPAAIGKAEYNSNMWDEFFKARAITLSELICYRQHPIDKIDILLKNNIPIVMVYGDSDTVVPYSENGAILEKFYSKGGGMIKTFCKEGCGHHPHGLQDPAPIIDFIMEHCI